MEKNAPAVAIKLEKKEYNVDGLFVTEIEAILFQVYNVIMQGKSKLKKPDYVEEITKNITKYELFLSSVRTVTETTVPTTVTDTTATNTTVMKTTAATSVTEKTATNTTVTETTAANSGQS